MVISDLIKLIMLYRNFMELEHSEMGRSNNSAICSNTAWWKMFYCEGDRVRVRRLQYRNKDHRRYFTYIFPSSPSPGFVLSLTVYIIWLWTFPYRAPFLCISPGNVPFLDVHLLWCIHRSLLQDTQNKTLRQVNTRCRDCIFYFCLSSSVDITF